MFIAYKSCEIFEEEMFGNSTGVETRSKKKKEQSPKSHQKKFAKLKVSSVDDALPANFSCEGMLLVRDIIDRKIGDCIGIKRLASLGYPLFPEALPTHVYIWFIHFFELSEFITDMISAETLNPGSTNRWIKFVRCICEINMYQRQPVHDYKPCFDCRKYFEQFQNKSIWWLYIGNDKFIRLTFKDFIEEKTFECCVLSIRISGLMEVQLEVEHESVGCSIRRSFSVATKSSVINRVNPLLEKFSEQLRQSVQDHRALPENNISHGSSNEANRSNNSLKDHPSSVISFPDNDIFREANRSNNSLKDHPSSVISFPDNDIFREVAGSSTINGANPSLSEQLQQSAQDHPSSVISFPENDISCESVPDFESSHEGPQPEPKRPKTEKNWVKIRDFENSREANAFIQNEKFWSKNTKKETVWGNKVFYRCNKAKLRGKQCDSGLYLLFDTHSLKVTLYQSSNEHSCDKDGNTSKSRPISEEVKQFIINAFNDGFRTRKIIQCKLATAKLPNPKKNQLNNFLKELREHAFGPSKLSLNEMQKFFVDRSNVPDDPDEPFVVDHHIDFAGEGNFRCFVSTKNLLKNAINREVLSADTTYKMIWEGFPLAPIGTTDLDRHFHLYGTLLSKDEKSGDFEFAFRAIKSAVHKIHGHEMKPTVLICDMSGAIHNGAKAVFGDDIFIRACWFHMKKALKLNLSQLITDKAIQKSILSDVDVLQLSQSPEIFNRASKLFIQKYQKHEDFVKYFTDVWLEDNRNWYEGCTPIPSPSTNNSLESWNSLIKKEKSFRSRFPLNQFLNLFFEWHLQWSQEYSSGAKQVFEIPTVDLDLYTKSYNWARLNKPLKSSVDANGSKNYIFAAGNSKVVDFELIDSWTTFDQFKNRAFIGWRIVWEDNWRNSICNCPAYMKKYICKHVVGIAYRKKLIDVPIEAKNVPVGKKRKRGRPSKARKALLVE